MWQLTAAVLVSALLFLSCAQVRPEPITDNRAIKPATKVQPRTAEGRNEASGAYGPPVQTGTLKDRDIKESSGVVASRANPDIFWTHNDSGDGPFIYAFDRTGARRGVFRVDGASAVDWEDIAMGPGPTAGPYLYIGDIGDNLAGRDTIVVYRVREPEVSSEHATVAKRSAPFTSRAEAIRLKYPDGRHDAEALLVHPSTGDLYIVTKKAGEPAGVYRARAPLSTAEVTTLTRIADFRIPNVLGSIVTGGDISPDGSRVIICDYFRAYELVLPAAERTGFDAIWSETPDPVEVGPRSQGEAICYALDGESILVTSEGIGRPILEVHRR